MPTPDLVWFGTTTTPRRSSAAFRWQPRHSLGAILVSADRLPEAEAVYRTDLARWPENGWSLYGLAECLKARKSPEADEIEARFKNAWQHADTRLAATCLCVEMAEAYDTRN